MQELSEKAGKECRRVVGLISGTSADGVDAALVELRGSGANLRCSPLAFETLRWPEVCLLYTSPSPRDATLSRMPSSA